MKVSNYYIFSLLLLLFAVSINCSCQSKVSKENRIFAKKPIFDSVLNEFAKPIGYVNDYENIYTEDQVYEMDSLIYDFETKNSLQIVIITLDSSMTNAAQIDNITATIGNGWKVGGDSSKGLVIGISKMYKRMRIQNGKYIQKFFSDSTTKEIIDSSFIPQFRKGLYYEGTVAGLKAIMKKLEDAFKVRF